MATRSAATKKGGRGGARPLWKSEVHGKLPVLALPKLHTNHEPRSSWVDHAQQCNLYGFKYEIASLRSQ